MGIFNNKNRKTGNSAGSSWLTPPGARKQSNQQIQQQRQQYHQSPQQQQQQQQQQNQQYQASIYGSRSAAVPPPAYNPSSMNMNSNAVGSTSTSTSTPPKKYINVNGVMKKNPEYARWQSAQEASASSSSSSSPPAAAPAAAAQKRQQLNQQYQHQQQQLGFVSNMDDHARLTEDLQQDVPLAESTNATIEMMQEPEISLEAGMRPDQMVDSLGAILGKYECPLGLMNKLMMISEYQSLEFIVDDSGSMNLTSDTVNPTTGQPNTRWQEAHQRLKEMVEILAYVPFTQIGIEFLNRPDRIQLKRNQNMTGGGGAGDGVDNGAGVVESPTQFLQRAYGDIDRAFLSRPPSGTTPVLEKLQESFLRGQGYSIARYLMCDGRPNGGQYAIEQITQLVVHRADPASNPLTFLSCTNEDHEVEWMKDAEEVAPYCSEADDYDDERREVVGDQGLALPYTRGFWLICQLVAAMNPDDLDAMDESVPFTKQTLDNLLGHVSSDASYKYYWDHFLQAQSNRVVARENGQPSSTDQLKKRQRWNYNDFLRAPVARDIPQVQQFKAQLIQLSLPSSSQAQYQNHQQRRW